MSEREADVRQGEHITGNTVALPDATADSVSEEIVFRLAETTDQDVTELDPLYGSIDPEALDALVDSFSSFDASITFTHEGCTITVDAYGTISIALTDS